MALFTINFGLEIFDFVQDAIAKGVWLCAGPFYLFRPIFL